MKIKRAYINIIVIMIGLLCFFQWDYNFNKKTVTTNSLVKFYKVYLITTDKQYQYWTYMNQGASDMANSLGIKYIWAAPEVRSAEKQIEVINKAINDGANAILVAADDPKKITAVIEDAKARNVKVIYVDSPANEEAITTLATNNYEAGVLAGRAMLTILEKQGKKNGSVGIVSYREKENTDLRELGFRKIIEEDSRFKILDTVLTNGDPTIAKLEANNLIKNNLDLVGLFGTNEGTSQGVGLAIKEDNNRIAGIGFDRTDAMLQLLETGSLKAIIVQNPYTMGYLGIAEAVAAIMGKNTGPSYINTGVSVMFGDKINQ